MVARLHVGVRDREVDRGRRGEHRERERRRRALGVRIVFGVDRGEVHVGAAEHRNARRAVRREAHADLKACFAADDRSVPEYEARHPEFDLFRRGEDAEVDSGDEVDEVAEHERVGCGQGDGGRRLARRDHQHVGIMCFEVAVTEVLGDDTGSSAG